MAPPDLADPGGLAGDRTCLDMRRFYQNINKVGLTWYNLFGLLLAIRSDRYRERKNLSGLY